MEKAGESELCRDGNEEYSLSEEEEAWLESQLEAEEERVMSEAEVETGEDGECMTVLDEEMGPDETAEYQRWIQSMAEPAGVSS